MACVAPIKLNAKTEYFKELNIVVLSTCRVGEARGRSIRL